MMQDDWERIRNLIDKCFETQDGEFPTYEITKLDVRIDHEIERNDDEIGKPAFDKIYFEIEGRMVLY